MSDNTSDTSGLLRYRLWILVRAPEWEHDISFNAYGPVLPRIGERLEFSGEFDEELTVRVTEVDHNWYLAGAGVGTPAVTVAAEISDSRSLELAIRLAEDSAALTAWVSKFPYLQPVDFTTEL